MHHHKSGGRFDEHWSPIYQFCTPCSINFTLIAKMETFQRDTEYIIRQAGLETLLLNKMPKTKERKITNSSPNSTKKLMSKWVICCGLLEHHSHWSTFWNISSITTDISLMSTQSYCEKFSPFISLTLISSTTIAPSISRWCSREKSPGSMVDSTRIARVRKLNRARLVSLSFEWTTTESVRMQKMRWKLCNQNYI